MLVIFGNYIKFIDSFIYSLEFNINVARDHNFNDDYLNPKNIIKTYGYPANFSFRCSSKDSYHINKISKENRTHIVKWMNTEINFLGTDAL
jgi:hypothetical protein